MGGHSWAGALQAREASSSDSNERAVAALVLLEEEAPSAALVTHLAADAPRTDEDAACQPHASAVCCARVHDQRGWKARQRTLGAGPARADPLGGRPALLSAARAAGQALQRAQLDGVRQVHVEAKAAWREARAKALRERMAALKASDLEGYLRLARQAKSSRIDSLLAQTDACLRRLTDRLCEAGQASKLPAAEGAPQAGPAAASALEESSSAWNRLATAIDTGEPRAQPPLLAGGDLREYQMQGLRWMLGLRAHGINGILADEMGLGKTIQVISLAAHLAGGAAPWAGPLLIAMPASVLPNWEREFEVWAPSLRVVAYRGNADARAAVFSTQMAGGRARAPAAGERGPPSGRHPFHVVLTTYECLMGKEDRPRLARIPWHYIVLDEGHRLKNADCKLNAELRAYSAANRLLLTGTPISNNLAELWSLLNFLMPALFGSTDDFHTWFSHSSGGGDAAAALAAEDPDAAAEAALLSEEEELIVTSRLHQVLRPFMLRRMKEAVAGELPAKQERLLLCPPSAYQRALLDIVGDQLGGGGGGGEGKKAINNAMMAMRSLCNHPLISHLHPDGSEERLPPHPLPPEVRLCGKLEVLDRALVKLRAAGHRVLLFCTMTRLLDVLESYLEWRGFEHLRLDGGTGSAERGELVRRFNAPGSSSFIFLLSVRAGGVGLNLQSADTVIMYDTDWNPQMDLQAQARAHRIGQTKDVLVLRLATAGSVEERIISVAASKKSMADRSITGGLFDGKASAAERQRFLLELIRSSSAAQQQGHGQGGAGGGDSLTDSQLNELLARSEEERALFEGEDERRTAVERSSWRGLRGLASGMAGYSRLAGPEEVAPLVVAAVEQARPVDKDAGKEFGRGKRCRDDGGGATATAAEPPRAATRHCAPPAASAPLRAAPPPRKAPPARVAAETPPAPGPAAGAESMGRLVFDQGTERLRAELEGSAPEAAAAAGRQQPGAPGGGRLAKAQRGTPSPEAHAGASSEAPEAAPAAAAAGVLVLRVLTGSDLDGKRGVALPTAATEAAFPASAGGLPAGIPTPDGDTLRTSTHRSKRRIRYIVNATSHLSALGAKQGDVVGICSGCGGQGIVFELNTPRLLAALNNGPAPAVSVPAPAEAAAGGKPLAAKPRPVPAGGSDAAQQNGQPQPQRAARRPPAGKPALAAVPALPVKAARTSGAKRAPTASPRGSGSSAPWEVVLVKALTSSDVERAMVLPGPAMDAAFPGAASGGLPASIPVVGGEALALSAATSQGKTRFMLATRAYLVAAGAKQGDAAGICHGPSGQLLFEVGTPRMEAALQGTSGAAADAVQGGKKVAKRRRSSGGGREA